MNIPENFDRWMFDYKEGNLSGSELKEFENFLIQNPEFEVEADAWENAFIQNEEFVYPDADKLEKRDRFAASYKWAAAAAILLLIGGSTLFVLNSGKKDVFADFGANAQHAAGNESSTIKPTKLLTTQADFSAFSNTSGSNGPVDENRSNTADIGRSSAPFETNSGWDVHAVGQSNTVVSGQQGFSSEGSARNSYGSHDLAYTNNKIVLEGVSIDQEKEKFEKDDNAAKYQSNPVSGDLKFDVSKKGSVNYNSLRNKVKRIYRKVEKTFGYPVGLKNLRDPVLNIPQSTLLATNPGFAGGALTSRFQMNYRNQWWGSNMNSQSLNMSFDNYSYNLRGGYGVMVSAQDYGLGGYNDVNVSLFYSPKIVLGKNFMLEPAVKFTMGSVSANSQKLAGVDQLEINRGRGLDMTNAANVAGTRRMWYKDYGLGFMLNSEWFYAGFSADNLAGHYENVYTSPDGLTPSHMPTKISAVVGGDYEGKSKTMTFSPFFVYQKFSKRNELWGGLNYRLKWATLGGAVSTNKQFTASAGVQFERFRLIYRYDRTISQYLPQPVGSHNVGIRITGKPNKKPRLRN